MLKNFIALASALVVAITMGLVAAPASHAVEAGKYEVQHLPGYAQTDGNYQIQISYRDGSSTTLYPKGYRDNSKWVTSAYYNSPTTARAIRIPPGKCVWEEVWGNFGKTWYGNFNYCNPSSNIFNFYPTLEGSKLREANGIESRLRFIKYNPSGALLP